MSKNPNAKLRSFIWESQMGKVELVRAKGIDNSFPRHSHKSYCLGLVEQGCRVILQEGQAAAIPEGSLFIIQPKQSHACRSAQAEAHSYSVICLSEDYMADLADRAGFPRGRQPAFSSMHIDDKHLANAFRRLLEDFGKCVYSSRLGSGMRKLISGLLGRHASPLSLELGPGSRPHAPEIIARDFLESRFNQPITLDALSKAVGLSRFHLQRLFLKSMGCSPKEYLLQHRIKVARQLLLKGLPFSQVALETGFYDQGHFTNRFKIVTGVTPGRFSRCNSPVNGTKP